MTKNEFIQQAALRLITAHPEAITSAIAGMARKLADEIYGEDEQTTTHPEELDDEPIENLLKEIDRRDEIKKAEVQKKWPGYRGQKGGYSKRLAKVFDDNNIQTVGDLLNVKSHNFLKMKHVGHLCFMEVKNILHDNYGITTW